MNNLTKKLYKARKWSRILTGILISLNIFTLISGFFRLFSYSSQLELFWAIFLILITPLFLVWNLRNFKRSEKWYSQELTQVYHLRKKIELLKKKLITESFRNLVVFAENQTWAEKELDYWRDVVKTERFKQMSILYKKEVLVNMINLNVFLEKSRKTSDEQKQILKKALKEREPYEQ